MASIVTNRSDPTPTIASDEYYNNATSYHEKLDAKHVNVPEDDDTVMGQLVKFITALVGGCFNPQQLIILFRLLKAVTFCCLCATLVSECIYLFLVEITVSHDVLKKIGGTRDEVIRLYGIWLTLIAILIELDMSIVDRKFFFMKGFLVRSCLLFFVTFLSGVHPIIGYENNILSTYRNYDDDQYVAAEYPALIASEVPSNAVRFQGITTFFLFICASMYFVMGLLCLDRFTADAFLEGEYINAEVVDESGYNRQQRGDNWKHLNTTNVNGDISVRSERSWVLS